MLTPAIRHLPLMQFTYEAQATALVFMYTATSCAEVVERMRDVCAGSCTR